MFFLPWESGRGERVVYTLPKTILWVAKCPHDNKSRQRYLNFDPPQNNTNKKCWGNDSNVITRSKRRCPEPTIGTWLFSGMALWFGTRCWILEVLTRDKLPCSWSRFVRHWRSCSSAFGMGIGIWVCHIWLEIVGRICPTSTFIRQTAVCENMRSILCDLTRSPASAIPPSICLKLGSISAYV